MTEVAGVCVTRGAGCGWFCRRAARRMLWAVLRTTECLCSLCSFRSRKFGVRCVLLRVNAAVVKAEMVLLFVVDDVLMQERRSHKTTPEERTSVSETIYCVSYHPTNTPFTRYNRLSNWLFNRFTQPVVSCKRGITRCMHNLDELLASKAVVPC